MIRFPGRSIAFQETQQLFSSRSFPDSFDQECAAFPRFDCRTEGTQRIPDRNCPGSCAKKKAAAFPGKRYSCLESGSSGVSPRPGGMAARGSTGERAETHEQAAAREKMSCGWTRPS